MIYIYIYIISTHITQKRITSFWKYHKTVQEEEDDILKYIKNCIAYTKINYNFKYIKV